MEQQPDRPKPPSRSIFKILPGIALIGVAVVVANYNMAREEESIDRIASLEREIIRIEPAAIDPVNEGKLVFFSAEAVGDSILIPTYDLQFSALAVRLAFLKFKVSSQKNTTHNKGVRHDRTEESGNWFASSDVNTSKPRGERLSFVNPIDTTFWAPQISIGPFIVPILRLRQPELLYRPYDLAKAGYQPVKDGRVMLHSNNIAYFGLGSEEQPKHGDVKMIVSTVPEGEYSVLGMQEGSSIVPYSLDSETNVFRVEHGQLTIEEVIRPFTSANALVTWSLHVLTLILGIGGIAMTLFLLKK